MRKLNKQDLAFIGKIVLYIVVTFMLYFSIARTLITDNCHPNIGGLGYAGYTCFGYFYFFDKISIYTYMLFLWITIVLFIRRKYLFPSNRVYLVGILMIVLFIIYMYTITPTDIPKGFPLRVGH